MAKQDKSQYLEMWDKQPGESQKAYAAFCKYRDMGIDERSVRKVAHELDKSSTLIGRWSSRYNWVQRVEAWDLEVDRQSRLAQVKAIKEMNARHATQAKAMQLKALSRLKGMLPEEMTVEQVRLYLIYAAKLERLAMGEPEDIEEIRRQDEYERGSIAAELATNAGFLDAVQQAIGQGKAGDNTRSGSGHMAPRHDEGGNVGEASSDSEVDSRK